MSPPPELAVNLADVGLRYGETRILGGISLALKRGEVLALLGPSGCGKTTLLRLVAGLLTPTEGRIEITGRTVADAASGLSLPPEGRGLGMVFQDYALWPHMSVAQNVAFPLEMRGVARAEREDRVRAALETVGLATMAGRRPADLSGGQQQRVAIARAIVAEPPLVLFDEPLSNLDRELREQLVDEIGTLVARLGLTAIYVTHDQSEAFALADRVAVMAGGGIRQLDTPETLVSRPADPLVAEFLRLGPSLPVRRAADGWEVAQTGMRIAPPPAHVAAHTGTPTGAEALVLLPTAALRLGEARPDGLRAEVRQCRFTGRGYALSLALAGTGHAVQVTSPRRLAAGETVGLVFDPEDLRWFPGAAA